MRTIIVTSTDSGFFHMAKGTILSIKDRPESAGVDLGLLDVGLAEDQAQWFRDNGVTVVAPGWDLRHPYPDRLPVYRKAFFSRPFLPEHFPGYDMYIWMDADAWVQDWHAIETFVEGAKDGALSIAPELDRAYPRDASGVKIKTALGRPYKISSLFYMRFRRAWGRRAANFHALRPILNNGVFALRADAPHWQQWKDAYQEGLDRYPRVEKRPLCQAALNYAVYEYELPFTPMPARFNWLAYLALPKIDAASGDFVEPLLPHDRIGIVHNAAGIKTHRHKMSTTDGKPVERTLLYRDGDY